MTTKTTQPLTSGMRFHWSGQYGDQPFEVIVGKTYTTLKYDNGHTSAAYGLPARIGTKRFANMVREGRAVAIDGPATCDACGNWLMGAECLGTTCNLCLTKRAAERKYAEHLERTGNTELGHYIYENGQEGFGKAFHVTITGNIHVVNYKYQLGCWLSDGTMLLSPADLKAMGKALKAALMEHQTS
jgi:hypothetical protein